MRTILNCDLDGVADVDIIGQRVQVLEHVLGQKLQNQLQHRKRIVTGTYRTCLIYCTTCKEAPTFLKSRAVDPDPEGKN